MLRYFLIVCALTAGALAAENDVVEEAPYAEVTPYIMEEEIAEFVRNLSNYLRPHDPYLIREFNLNVDNDWVKAEFESTDIVFRGFSVFEATEIKNSITIFPPGVKSTFKLRLNEFHLIVPYYYLDLMAVFIPFYGSGSVNLKIKEVNLAVKAQIATGITGKLTVKKLNFAFNMTDASLYVTGIIHNEPLSQIVSTSTTECFAEFVNTHNDRLGELLGDALIDPINKFLNPPKEEEAGGEFILSDDVLKAPEERVQNALNAAVMELTEKNVKIGPYDVTYRYRV